MLEKLPLPHFVLFAATTGIAQVSNRVTNTADFDRVVRRWAETLNKHLAQLENS